MIILYLLGQSGKPLLFADCEVVPQSSPTQLASIAIISIQTYRELVGNEFYGTILSLNQPMASLKGCSVDDVVNFVAVNLAMG